MELIEQLVVGQERGGEPPAVIELLAGALSALPEQHAVDSLVLSAFSNSYTSNRRTLFEALYQDGLDMRHTVPRPAGLSHRGGSFATSSSRAPAPASHTLFGTDYNRFPMTHSAKLLAGLTLPNHVRRGIERDHRASCSPVWPEIDSNLFEGSPLCALSSCSRRAS